VDIYLFLAVISLLAGFIQGLSGFGSVLLSLPLLVFLLDVKTAIPLVALYGLALSVFLLVQLREHWDWKKLYPLCLSSVPGAPLGVWLLNRLDAQVIQWAVGGFLLVYALFMLFFRPAMRVTGAGWAYLSGFIAGCLGGAIGASGPPVIVYTSLQPWSKDDIKVTLQGFFVISGIVVVFFQALGGLVTGTVLWYFAVTLPLLLTGTWLGSLLYGRIREEGYRKLILMLLALLGLFMIVK
jgi:uncharacterized membrane protein YfcA